MKIETLAVAIQKDFNDIRRDMAAMRAEMATKEELRSTKDEILGAIKDLKQVVERNDSKLSLCMARTDEIDIRLRVVEKRG